MQTIYTEFPKTTAIIGENDLTAFNIYRELHRQAPERAERIALGGFGNLISAQSIHPFITVDQHPYELGCSAVQLYLDWRNDGKYRQ